MEFNWEELEALGDDDEDDSDLDIGLPMEEDDMSDDYELFTLNTYPSKRAGHVAIRVDKYILVFGGYRFSVTTFGNTHVTHEEYVPNSSVWVYDLSLEMWSPFANSSDEEPIGTSGATASVLDDVVYMMFGHTQLGKTNKVWKLSRHGKNKVKWEKMKFENDTDQFKQPSPRDKLVSWEYDGKLWAFGGYGPSIDSFLHKQGNFVWDDSLGWNNQLLSLDPDTKSWDNLMTKGCIPSPRAACAATKIGSKVWLFGGRTGDERLRDFYELDLVSLTWTEVRINSIERPIGRTWHSLNAISSTKMVLHGGYSTNKIPLGDTWMYDLKTGDWHQYSLPVEKPVLWHGAEVGLDGEVLVFGGCTNDILDPQSVVDMSEELRCIQTKPKSLLRICLAAVYQQEKLKPEWSSLPWNLASFLATKDKLEEERKRLKNPHVTQNSITTCVIC